MRPIAIRIILMCTIAACCVFEANAGISLQYSLPLPGIAKDVEIKGSIAYVSTDSGLAAVDVSDPANPQLKSFVRLPGHGNELSILGDLAFVTDGKTKAAHIANIFVPEYVHYIGSVEDTCGYVWGIASRETCDTGSRGMVAVASLSGLSLFGVPLCDCDSAYGVLLSRFSPYRWITLPPDSLVFCDSCLGGSQWIKTDDVVLDSTFAYVLYYDNAGYSASSLCLKKVDLSDPSNPRCIDSLELHSFGCALAVSNGYAYVTHNSPLIGSPWNAAPEIDIIDVTTGPMAVRGSLRLPGRSEDVVVTEKQAYIACSRAGVSVVDVSDPQRPVQIDSFPFSMFSSPPAAYGIAPVDTNIYVAAGERGLMILRQNSTAVVRDRAFSDRRGDPVFKTEYRSGSIILRFRTGFSGNVSINLYNLNGRAVLQRPYLVVQKGTMTVRCVDRLNRPLIPGMYFLHVKADGGAEGFEKVLIR